MYSFNLDFARWFHAVTRSNEEACAKSSQEFPSGGEIRLRLKLREFSDTVGEEEDANRWASPAAFGCLYFSGLVFFLCLIRRQILRIVGRSDSSAILTRAALGSRWENGYPWRSKMTDVEIDMCVEAYELVDQNRVQSLEHEFMEQ